MQASAVDRLSNVWLKWSGTHFEIRCGDKKRRRRRRRRRILDQARKPPTLRQLNAMVYFWPRIIHMHTCGQDMAVALVLASTGLLVNTDRISAFVIQHTRSKKVKRKTPPPHTVASALARTAQNECFLCARVTHFAAPDLIMLCALFACLL